MDIATTLLDTRSPAENPIHGRRRPVVLGFRTAHAVIGVWRRIGWTSVKCKASRYPDGMQISLKPELRRFIEQQVKAGRFSTLEEVLEAGVARLMLDDESGGLD